MARPISVQPVNFTLIRQVVDEQDKTLTEVADAAGTRLSQLSEMLAGTRKMNDQILQSIADYLETPVHYLRTPIGRMVIQKVELDVLDWARTPERHDVKELTEYLDVTERMGYIDFAPELSDVETVQQWDFWKKDTIIPFRSEKAIDFWEFEGDEILIRGPARCGKSTLILEWLITTMFKNAGMQVLITRAFAVDLDTVRQNIMDIVKYRFSNPLSSISVSGGNKFHTVQINGGEIQLKGIDRPGGMQGAGFEIVIHSQAEQIKKENIDYINSRCTPASNRWMEDGVSRSMVIYDANPNRLDHWIEAEMRKGMPSIAFDFVDHPAYFTEDGEETELFKGVYRRLSKLEGVVRQRLLDGVPANPEGTIFMLEECHLLKRLPEDFFKRQMFYRGFDFGMKDPSVCLWVGVDRQTGDVTIYQEWRRVGVDTIEMGEAVKTFTNERVLDTIIDNDENLQSILRKNCGIPTTLAQKGPNSIASGIALILHRLKLAKAGEPGGLYFYNNPVVRDPVLIKENLPLTIIDEADLYAWEEKSDKPIDKHNHGWDVVRYILDFLEHGRSAIGFGGGGVTRKGRL